MSNIKEKTAANTAIQRGFYSVKEAAEFVGVDTKTIRRMIDRGELPARMLGRIIRIPASALEFDALGVAR